MGAAKHEMMMQEDRVRQATDIAIKAGALKECYLHSDIAMRAWDSDAESLAYAMATISWKNGEMDGTRQDVMEAVKEAIEEGPIECWHCVKLADD
jgi:hypothetical protein